MWNEILKEEEPDLPFLKAFWYYARSYAYIGKNELERAYNELEKLRIVMKYPAISEIKLRDVRNTTEELLSIACEILIGEIEAKKKNYKTWSLFGLEKSLRAQGRNKEADEVQKEFKEAWSKSDIEILSSRIL